MKEFLGKLRVFSLELAGSPWQCLRQTGRGIIYRFRPPRHVERLRQGLRSTPLILQIETTNVCNAACVFCAYPAMQRKKGVMSLELFQKVVADYAEMGGGPVSLTPVVGDALLDPHLMERLRILRAEPRINQITLTTNAIALERYSDRDLSLMLEALYCIQVSIGGMDAAGYRAMYGVDRFAQVEQSLERLFDLNGRLASPAQLSFAYRTNDRKFEARFRSALDSYRQRGAFISHIWSYANYSGEITGDEHNNLTVLSGHGRKALPCVYGSVAMSVCWDGAITACGCADFEGRQLSIGDADKQSLAEVWLGKKRSAILASFAAGTPAGICKACSAYQPDTIFAQPCFTGIEPHRPLPLGFFQQFWGG
jgi:MoaA/NifB/PqqE/SkfB family radical SAM enzyme